MYLAVLDGNAVDSFVKNVKSLDAFIHIQPNFVYHLFSVSEDEPEYNLRQKDALEFMKFSDVWHISSGNNTTVAILDTGLQINHQEFCDGAMQCPNKIVSPEDVVHDLYILGYKEFLELITIIKMIPPMTIVGMALMLLVLLGQI